jgi:predicted metal-dependent TIM-barrel fold hydrolase
VQSLEITAAADPARHAWNVLADFVDSLTGVEARRAVQKLVNWDRKLQVHPCVLPAAGPHTFHSCNQM